MQHLTDSQKQNVIRREPTLGALKLADYILRFDNLTLDDFPNMSPAKRKEIEDIINKPDPDEVREWQSIEQAKANGADDNTLKALLGQYVENWKDKQPPQNHLSEANLQLQILEEKIEWEKLDLLDKSAIKEYLHRFPNIVHKDELDDSFWSLCNKSDLDELYEYLSLFPDGRHASEAKRILDSFAEWERAKNSGDIFIVKEYIDKHPISFVNEARNLLLQLKQQELNNMKANPEHYELARMMNLIDCHIFSDEELIHANVTTKKILEILRKGDPCQSLPDINKIIANSHPDCKPGYIDVYLFGIPATGKTCVLMGLSCSGAMDINLASQGGNYVAALQQYTDAGVTIPPTPLDFVTTIEATIPTDEGRVHKVNLVEMSGGEFAYKISNNPDQKFSFEDMGTGTTKLLLNENHKMFFLIVDPTANVITDNLEIPDFDDDGNYLGSHIETVVVNQRILLQKMVNIFQNPSNKSIMRNVDSIHIILTKADTLAKSREERKEKALELFNADYSNAILRPLVNVCKQYNINNKKRDPFRPNLYTFSLGSFYIGNLFQYDDYDSRLLVNAIINGTPGVHEKTLWDKIKKIFN